LLHAPAEQEIRPAERRQRQTRLAPVDQRKVIVAYESGRSVYELAQEFSITRQTASAILKRHGIKLRYNVLGPDDLQEAMKRYLAGDSLATIGRQFGVNASTVRRALLSAGVQTRPNGTNQWRT
jgi:hypothetical protein